MPKGQSNSGQKNSSVNPQMQSIKASNQAMQSYFNAVNAQFRAQAAFIRLNKMTAPKQAPQAPDFGKAFNRLIMSSRFSIQNGHVQFQPLVGNLVRAFGPLVEALGPLAAPVLAVTAAIVGLAAAADKASEVLKGWNLAGARAGTTGENLGQMAGIGHFLGMKPEELAGMVRQFSEELGSGGTATAMGIRHGIRDFSGGNPFIGPLDSFQNFKKLIDEMSSATEDEAMRMVRAFGAAGEAAYQFRGLSKEQHDALIDAYKGMSTPAMIAAQKQHQYATAMLSIQWEKLILASTPFINALTLMTDSIIMGMEYFKQFVIMQFSGLIEIDKWIKRIIGMKVDDGDAKTAMQQSQESQTGVRHMTWHCPFVPAVGAGLRQSTPLEGPLAHSGAWL